MLPDEVDYVIYHYPCTDGFGSAFAAWKYLSVKYPERNVTYFPALIGAEPPRDLEGRNVLICDYSYSKEVILSLLSKVKNLLIIDHHKTSKKELEDIPEGNKIFDMNHSGAYLTWRYFFPDSEVPLMIEYIQDRDIWTKKMPNNEQFFAWFYTLPFNLKYSINTSTLRIS